MGRAQARPFSVSGISDQGRVARLNAVVAAFVDKASGLSRLQAIYRSLPHSPSMRVFLQRVLEVFEVRYLADCSELAKIPGHGPALVVANHPFGAIEGIILAKLLLEIRPDVKVMANHLLSSIPELRGLFIAVDPFAGEHSKTTNRRPLRTAIRWLSEGGLLLVFPAGEVSHLHWRLRAITDPRWSPTVARLAEKTRSLVLPAYIFGSNSVLFQLFGLIHPRLRTAMLPRELNNKAASPIHIRIGDAIPYQRLAAFPDIAAKTRYLRFCTYLLRDLDDPILAKPVRPKHKHRLAPAVAKDALRSDLNALPPHHCLGTSGTLSVWYAHAHQVPFILQEIGRLRELTFRRVGEGTGKAADIDLFDSYYLHLFAWDSENEKLVGAYRMGLTDDIIARFGAKGLYTNTLFKLKRPVLARLNPAIELGRSFVRPAYQKRHSALLLLWCGIGHFVATHPRYRFLFGPVSISSDYRSISQQLMVAFLRVNRFDRELAHFVKPRRPFPARKQTYRDGVSDLKHIDQLSELISQIESDRKGCPVLLRQYLKLGGQLLGFNVDRDFNDTLDGLMMVDLLRAPPRALERYMGRAQATRFLAYQQEREYSLRRVS